MTPGLQVLQQLALMGLEAVLVAALLLALFRTRRVFGLAPIYVALGVVSQMAALLSASVYVKVGPGLLLGPGSTVLFPAILFAVLFVYIREDAGEARRLIYALVAASVVMGLLGLLATLHLRSSATFNPLGVPVSLFVQQPRLVIVGTLVLLFDTILIILLYEYLGRTVALPLFARVYASMALVMAIDTVLFVTGSFYELPQYRSILLSDLAGKSVACLPYAALLTVYLQRFDVRLDSPAAFKGPLRDLFQVLTYREKYEALRLVANMDALTAVYNRGFFDSVLSLHVEGARRSGTPLTLMLIDVDHFKAVNDARGHAAGDELLVAIAAAIKASVRTADVVARYGGEEFAVVLPATTPEQGLLLAERVRSAVPLACQRVAPGLGPSGTTVTIGVATLPDDSADAAGLVRAADERLYAGKRQGRNRVVAERPEARGRDAQTS